MNQSKFSLADILTVIATLGFGFVSFLGVNFLNIDNASVWGMSHTKGCIAISIVITLLLFSFAFGAKVFKRTKRNYKTSFIGEIIFLLLFLLLALFLASKSSPFLHYFTVTAEKADINSKLQKNITQAENMFTAYENYADNREKLYRQKLKSVVIAKRTNPTEYLEYGFKRGVSDAEQIDTKMFTVHADLFPTNYSDTISNNGIKEIATKWLQYSKNTITSWKPIGIVGVVSDIESNSKNWLNTLVTLSKVREQGEKATDFEYSLSFDNVKTHFIKHKKPKLLAIGITVLMYFLMLLSWIVAKRHTGHPGFKYIFGLDKENDNEL